MPKVKSDFTNFIDARPNYFPGQFLLEDDFELQHKYLADRLRYQNRSLHVSGIIEGLEVEVIQDKQEVQIKHGSAINSNGDLIILKSAKSFSNFSPLTNGELFISYKEEEADPKQEKNSTRWKEVPTIGFAATTPNDGVKLAKISIVNNVPTLDLTVRSYSGIFLPNATGNDLTLRSGGNANPNLAILNGSLTVTGTITGNIDATNINSGTLDVARIPNLSAAKINSGLLTVERIPSLSADKITSGTLAVERIPNLSADKITSGTISGNLTVTTFLKIGQDASERTRDWMTRGMSIFGDSDNLFIGLKDEGSNRKDAVIAWGDDPEDDLRFINVPAGGAANGTEIMRLKPSGNVGIGTVTPSEKLEVSGKLKVTNNAAINNVFLGDVGHGSVWAGFSHTSQVSQSSYALLQNNTGTYTLINKKAGDGYIGFRVDNNDRMVINNNGNVGIGTTDPTRGKVHIEGFLNYQHPNGYSYLVDKSKNSNRIGDSAGNVPYSLYANERIGCSEFNAFSDLRIKEIIGNSDSQTDLQTLLRIQVTDYYYKDKIANDNKPKKKVIGQQIAAVYPQAVSTHADIVPDILQFAVIAENWVTLNNHNLKIGDKVKILWDDNETKLFPVEAIESDKFKISLNYNGDVFAYGREVDDFHVVDYDALSMLHISATQEIYRIIKKMQSEMNELKKEKSLY